MEERIGEGKSAFVVNDRRGEKKEEPEPVPQGISVVRREIESKKDKSRWVDVSFIYVQMQIAQGIVANLLRAVGKRSDDRTFVGDYIVPPFWREKDSIDDWQTEAKFRLDTFLGCECIEGTQCEKHNKLLAKWMEQDMQRYDKVARKAMPESLEWYIRAEQARQQSKIVALGR